MKLKQIDKIFKQHSLQLEENDKPKYRGTNMLLGEDVTEEFLKNRIKLYNELNINACIIVQHLKINLDWTYTIDATKEKIELACRLLKEGGILPMGIKFHFNFNPSMLSNVTDLPDSFISSYKTIIKDYMKVASRYGADSVIILNEMNRLTNYRNPPECLDKIKNLTSYVQGLGYKVSMSMNAPMINNCDDSIINMLDFICFNNYPCVSYEGLSGSKKKALEMLEMSSFVNGCISKAGNRKVYMSEIGCLDHELSLSAPEITGSVVEKEPMCGGKAKAFFWDVVLKWFENQNQIDGLFMWDGVTEFRPYEQPAKDVIKKYWKASDKLC